uniref:Uncharacterized protein LOC104235426 n=1 Tax=Nicotiana sylvestris TaxID=4096 RepID=A0A1U7XCW0_NICSY|nr:PREDICTED: uncharacterized protein LOC104235426 [Nicotiana sylvestris]
MPTPPGMLTFSSAWQILRHRDLTNPEYELLWTKGLSFKISFFLWRLQKGKIPTDDLWRRNGYLTVSKYWCCLPPQEETFQYIFLTSSTASRVWKMFLQAADIFRFFEGYKPYVVTKRVIWQLPYHGWFKYNTDGASRGNPGRCSYGFCVRDCARELVYAKAIEIGLSKNIIDEAKTIVEGFYYCVDMQLYPLIIETNLLVMKRTIDGEWNAPWCIGKEMKRINEMKDQFNVIFQHILREGNAVTEF